MSYQIVNIVDLSRAGIVCSGVGELFASVRLEKMIELITDSSEGSVITRKGIMVNLEEFSLVTADRSQRMIRRDLR